MELTDAQKETLSAWVGEGLGLSEIQKKLQEEFALSMTYMDVRFLVLDLDLAVKDKEIPADGAEAAEGASPEAVDESPPAGGPASPGGVSVELDRLMKPGSLVSGTVSFSDGVTASWSLDQFGRLALDAGQSGYSPSEEDLAVFQEQLRAALQKRGF